MSHLDIPKLDSTSPPPASIYLAGPMTGLPEFNYPKFEAVASTLRGKGYTVLSPAEIHHESSDQRGTKLWQQYMRPSLKLMLDAEAVYMLSGWSGSRGARIEWQLAQDLGIPVFYEGDLS